MGDATQATQSLPEVEDGHDEEVPKEKVWGRLISLNPSYANVELTGIEVVLGRQSCCNVQYNDNLNISGKHCRIFREPSVNGSVIAFVQDMSTNGTFVNGDKLGKGNRLLLSSGFEIALVLNKKKTQDKVAYIFQECAEDKPQEEGGPQKKYDIREALGAGNFAVVKLAINKATGGRFAIKIIDKKKYFNQAGTRKEALMDEVKILRSLNHKNIIRVEEMFDTEKTLYLVLELIEGGDLFGDLVREGHYTEQKTRDVFGQIIDAISFLHNQGIAHRDLKPENILLKTTMQSNTTLFDVKLSDFGLSRTIGEGSFMKTMCGTPQYLAPEILTSGGIDGYGKEVDMWSAGAILYVLLCGYPPFDDGKTISIFDQIRQGLVEFPDPAWTNVSPAAKDLIKRLLTVDPSKRYTAIQTRDHPWMKGESTLPPEMLLQDTLLPPVPPTPTNTPTTPTKHTQTPKNANTKPGENEAYGSVINYNKTLEEKATPPTTPTTNSTHSTPTTASPASLSSSSSSSISASPPPFPAISHSPHAGSVLTSPGPPAGSILTSSGSLAGKFEKVGLEKRKRTEDDVTDDVAETGEGGGEKETENETQKKKNGGQKKKEEDDDATDEDEALQPLSKSGSSIKGNTKAPSPPVPKKLKKSATAEITPLENDDEEEEDEGEKNKGNGKKKLKTSSSDQGIKTHNSFTSNSGGEEEEEEKKGGDKKGGKKKKDTRPMCMYGKGCYRKNPQHFKEYQHPS